MYLIVVGHLGCFHSLAIVNSVPVNMGHKCLYCILIYIPSNMCLGVVLLDHMVVLFLVFWGVSITAFHSGCTSLHSHQQFVSLSAFFFICVLDNSHSDLSEMKSQCSLVCISFMARDVEHFFIYLLAICISSFENCSVHLPISSLGGWFFGRLVSWSLCKFWLWKLCQMDSWQRFSPIL
jgi:hypothetical protein